MKNIKKRDLDDKLKVFELAGEDSSSGWDTAIPQEWFDQLLKMGIDSPVTWFVTDCKSHPYKLRHVGEALDAILEARSLVNNDVFSKMWETANDQHSSTQDKAVLKFVCNSPDNMICNESDSGFSDLNTVIAAFHAGWEDGSKVSLNRFVNVVKTAMKALVNEMERKPQPSDKKHIFASGIKPPDGINSSLRVVLYEWRPGEFVTHIENMQLGGFSYGHYFTCKAEAMTDYMNRCAQYGVEPF